MKESGRQTVFYGWFIVAACFSLTTMLGVTIWSFGVFFKPLEAEFGWTRALTSSAYTVFLIGYAASVIYIGRLIDRFNPRVVMIICAIVTDRDSSSAATLKTSTSSVYFI
jgi:MFS family permease